MRKQRLFKVFITAIVCMALVGCGRGEKDEATLTTENDTTTIKIVDKLTEDEADNKTTIANEELGNSVVSNESTDCITQEDTTLNEQEETTSKEKETTTKKEENITTIKQEETTTKKQEDITTKEEMTTPAKEKEEATVKQEETTTNKEESTEETVVTGNWFERKGYKITPKAEATQKAFPKDGSHECYAEFYVGMQNDFDEYEKEWCLIYFDCTDFICGRIHKINPYIAIPFDRYTGKIFLRGDKGMYGEGEFEFNGEKIRYKRFNFPGVMDMEEVYIPIEYYNVYDGAVFLVAKTDDIIINDGDSIDDLEFDVNDVFFLSTDDM